MTAQSSVRTEQYIKVPLAMYRSGISAVLGHNLIMLYNALKCYIYRDLDSGSISLKRLSGDRYLVAEVSQVKLSRLLGMKRQTVNKLLQQLEKIGWIHYKSLEFHRICTYVLGTWKITQEGKREEIFFADTFIYDLENRINEALVQREKKIALDPLLRKVNNNTDREEETEFRLQFVASYIPSIGKDLMDKEYSKNPVLCFDPVETSTEEISAILRTPYSQIMNSKDTVVDTSKVPIIEPVGTQPLLPESNTKYLRSSKKEDQRTKEDNIDHYDLYKEPMNGPTVISISTEQAITNISDPLIGEPHFISDVSPLCDDSEEIKTCKNVVNMVQSVSQEKNMTEKLVESSEKKKQDSKVQEDSLSVLMTEQVKKEVESVVNLWNIEFSKKYPHLFLPVWQEADYARLSRMIHKYGLVTIKNLIVYIFYIWDDFYRKNRATIRSSILSLSVFFSSRSLTWIEQSMDLFSHKKVIQEFHDWLQGTKTNDLDPVLDQDFQKIANIANAYGTDTKVALQFFN